MNKNMFYVLGLMLIILILLFWFKANLNEDIVDRISKIDLIIKENNIKNEVKFNELKKQINSLSLENEKIKKEKTNVVSKSISLKEIEEARVATKEAKEKVLLNNANLTFQEKLNKCSDIITENDQLICKNNLYYTQALEDTDLSLCDKIEYNSHDLDVCKIKVKSLKIRNNIY